MIHVKEGVLTFDPIQCEPQEIEPERISYVDEIFFTWDSLSRGSNFIDYRKWLKYQKKLYFSYVKLENVTKILPVLTFQKFKSFGPDQMFQINYFPIQHRLVTCPLPTPIWTRR